MKGFLPSLRLLSKWKNGFYGERWESERKLERERRRRGKRQDEKKLEV